ncbi:MAG TPA: 5-formyltetrahydrofolate cyclo-ligase [Solidesulfovibrio magneticus]|nr:5-formyltetrahydrofolate cyclo-ligase [Solidesulfovibrio magneticus]
MKTLQHDQTIDTGKALAKAALRRDMSARRAALTPQAVATAARSAAQRVLALPAYVQAREILAYMAVRNELDAGVIARQALADGKRLLLPRCRDGAPGLLDLGCVRCLSEAAPGSYGIPEPPREACLDPEAFSPDLILVPGLAFDRRGVRLGFGGGYYDRLLALPLAQNAFTVGLGYDFQLVAALPSAPWDKPVNAVVTDRQTLLTPP